MLWLTYPPNLKSLPSPVTEIWNALKMYKMGWFGVVRGHPRSSAISPFDRAHMISYSSLIETMHLSCTVFEIRQVLVICRNLLTSTYPSCIWHSHWGWPRKNFEKNLTSENWSPWAILRRCLHVPMFSHFSRTPTRDRQTDRDTHTDRGL